MEARVASTLVAAVTAARGDSILVVVERVAGALSTLVEAALVRGVVDTRGEVAMVLLAVTMAVGDMASVLAGTFREVDVVDTVLALAKDMEVAGVSKVTRQMVLAGLLSREKLVAQLRWNNNGRGGYQQRFRTAGHDAPARTTVDADLLQQTVQAVVAAVTTAQRTTDDGGRVAVHAVAGNEVGSRAPNQPTVMSVAAPTVVQQQMEMPNEAVEEAHVVGARGKENEGLGPSKKKKEDKTSCFRCKKPGHYIDDCPTPFCDLCESIHHVASACHLLQAPKPTAIIHGYANEALMFFELPCGAFKAKVENPKLAKVKVDGDAMTIPEIIEQLRKIVPHEKFNWEVFHYKDNIYRVKLPSKKEVQRLKNFGTYICQDREACLPFDLWSSLEEPLFMLPEVWVQVSGLPSDMRSDYLSLWGVGTLFGKTLDVDMAYTRKHKVLRTKIGCLDRNLIPADSDVFIRRGFFKLRFEVETAQQSQEVNMVDANNGNDGNDGAHHGEGKNGGSHAMEMDKGTDADATSNNNEQDASNVNNGVEGMQEQLHNIEDIQIGSMHVELNPKDLGARESILGLQPTSARAGCQLAVGQQQWLHAAIGQHHHHATRQQQQLPVAGVNSAAHCSLEQRSTCAGPAAHSLTTTCGTQQLPGAGVSSAARLPAETARWAHCSMEQRSTCVGPAALSLTTTCGTPYGAVKDAGLSVPGEKIATACVASVAQKILATVDGGTEKGVEADGNHMPMIGSAVHGLTAHDPRVGSAVPIVPIADGMSNVATNNFVSVVGNAELFISDHNTELIPDGDVSYGAVSVLEPKLVSSLEQTNEGITDEGFMTTREGLANEGLQESMGIVSSPRTNGEEPSVAALASSLFLL
ncbi:hypothetical protein ACQ4PT_027516 [Festuca glaucescens]